MSGAAFGTGLNDDDTDNFQEMLVRAGLVDEGLYIYRKILLRVNELSWTILLVVCFEFD